MIPVCNVGELVAGRRWINRVRLEICRRQSGSRAQSRSDAAHSSVNPRNRHARGQATWHPAVYLNVGAVNTNTAPIDRNDQPSQRGGDTRRNAGMFAALGLAGSKRK